MALYKVVIRYFYQNQPMRNVLWYEDVPPNPVGIDNVAACLGLGQWVRDNVCLVAPGQYRLSNLLPQDCVIEGVDVIRFNPPDQQSLMSGPVNVPVGVACTRPEPVIAPQSGVLIRLLCAPQDFNPLTYRPSGGYVLIGPTFEPAFTNGILADDWRPAYDNFSASLRVPASLGGGFDARPVRYGRGRPAPLLPPVWGWNPVSDTRVDLALRWRRSRTPR